MEERRFDHDSASTCWFVMPDPRPRFCEMDGCCCCCELDDDGDDDSACGGDVVVLLPLELPSACLRGAKEEKEADRGSL